MLAIRGKTGMHPTVFRSDAEPELFNVRQDLSAEPHLPGFHVAVKGILP